MFIKFDVGDDRRFSYDMIIGILFMKYSFRIIYGAATKSEAKVDFVLKNKIKTCKVQRINHHTMPVAFG